jgi:hypothetical protein
MSPAPVVIRSPIASGCDGQRLSKHYGILEMPKGTNAKQTKPLSKGLEKYREVICKLDPDYDGTPRSVARLCGILTMHFPQKPVVKWRELPADEVVGYVEATLIKMEKERAGLVMVEGGIKIWGKLYAVSEKLCPVLEEMIETRGYVSMPDFGLRARDLKTLPKDVRMWLESTKKQGTRFNPGLFD